MRSLPLASAFHNSCSGLSSSCLANGRTREKWGRERKKEKSLKYATIFAAYLSPGTGSLKLFTLILSFSSSVPAVAAHCLTKDLDMNLLLCYERSAYKVMVRV